MRKRHPVIACTVEALRGSGLTLRAAIVRAAKAWCLAEETIAELYKRHKLPEDRMKFVRQYFNENSSDQVEQFITQYRAEERKNLK